MLTLDRQMNKFERGLWSLWTLSLLSQSAFLWATQTMRPWSPMIWATGAIVLVVTVLVASITAVILVAWPRWREVVVNLLFAGALPACGLTLFYWKEFTWTVSWASFEALGAVLMFAWLVYDAVWLKKPEPDTVHFSDVVADAKRNAGES
jgi:hypothetical protein